MMEESKIEKKLTMNIKAVTLLEFQDRAHIINYILNQFRTSILDGCTDCKCNNGLVACRFLRSITDGCLYYEDSESTTPPPNGL
jgi:hypothetical protein